MLVFGTDYEYFNAVWVKNEWSRYLSLIKNGAKKVYSVNMLEENKEELAGALT